MKKKKGTSLSHLCVILELPGIKMSCLSSLPSLRLADLQAWNPELLLVDSGISLPVFIAGSSVDLFPCSH